MFASNSNRKIKAKLDKHIHLLAANKIVFQSKFKRQNL